MITKTGTITITDEQILITGFVFSGSTFQSAQVESIIWALGKLSKSLSEAQANGKV